MAVPHDAVPDRAARDRRARQRAVADLERTRSSGTSSASAAICVSAVHVPVPMSDGVDQHGVAAVAVDARRAPATGRRRVGIRRGGDAGSDEPAAVAARARASGSRAVPAEAPRALAQARDQAAAAERVPGLGIERRARCGCGTRPDRARTRSPSRPSPTRARTSPGTRRARASIDGVGTSSRASRCVVRRLGAAYIMRVATAVCSANSSSVEVCSTTSCAIAVSVPSRVGAEPHALDRRRAVADQREHLLPRQHAASPGRPATLAPPSR